MLIVENIELSYPDGSEEQLVLEGASFQLSRGLTALVGPSGVGKSSLLRVIAGLQRAQQGRISFEGVDHDAATAAGGLSRIATYVPQDFQLVPFLNARENIELAVELAELPAADATSFLNLVGLAGLESRLPDQLSGGQQQRLALARAMAVEAPVLLADEPTGSLDETTSTDISELLRRLAESRIVITATHDPVLMRAANTVLRLQNGHVVSAA